jgi:hypothetical protein
MGPAAHDGTIREGLLDEGLSGVTHAQTDGVEGAFPIL